MERLFEYCFLFCALSICVVVYADSSEWEVVKQRDGVVVKQREHADYVYKETIGFMETDAELLSILSVLKDVENCQQWLHKCAKGKVLEQYSAVESLNYTVLKGVLMVKPRETYVRSTVHYNPELGRVFIRMVGVDDYEPVKKKPVRILAFDGYWDLQRQGDGKTLMTYRMISNPQVSAIQTTNATLKTAVFETLKNVNTIAQTKNYSSHKFSEPELKAVIAASAHTADILPKRYYKK